MSHNVLCLFSLALLVFSGMAAVPNIVQAEWRDLHGKVHRDSDIAKGLGPFSAQLFMRKNVDETISAWGKLASAVYIPSQAFIKRKEPIIVMVGFNGCTKGPGDLCNLTVKYKVIAPDGTADKENNESELWQQKEPNMGNVLMVGVQYLNLTFDASDPLGKYTVEATVTDKVANKSMVLKRSFEVKE